MATFGEMSQVFECLRHAQTVMRSADIITTTRLDSLRVKESLQKLAAMGLIQQTNKDTWKIGEHPLTTYRRTNGIGGK